MIGIFADFCVLQDGFGGQLESPLLSVLELLIYQGWWFDSNW